MGVHVGVGVCSCVCACVSACVSACRIVSMQCDLCVCYAVVFVYYVEAISWF